MMIRDINFTSLVTTRRHSLDADFTTRLQYFSES